MTEKQTFKQKIPNYLTFMRILVIPGVVASFSFPGKILLTARTRFFFVKGQAGYGMQAHKPSGFEWAFLYAARFRTIISLQ